MFMSFKHLLKSAALTIGLSGVASAQPLLNPAPSTIQKGIAFQCAESLPVKRTQDLISAVMESPGAHPVTSSLLRYIRKNIKLEQYTICTTNLGQDSNLNGFTVPQDKHILINQSISSFLTDITLLHELAHVGFYEYLKSGAYNQTKDPMLGADQIKFDRYYHNAADEIIAQLVTSDAINILSQGFCDFLYDSMLQVPRDQRHNLRMELFDLFKERLQIPGSEMPQFIHSIRLLGEFRQLVKGDIQTFRADSSILKSLESSFHFGAEKPVQFATDGTYVVPTILDRKADRIELRSN